MPEKIIHQIGRTRPFGRLTPRQAYPLSLEKVRPMIRIAHRFASPLHIDERIIFDYELVLFLVGTGTFSFGQEQRTFAPHDLFLIPPFMPHTIYSAPGQRSEHLAVHFDWAQGVPVTGRLPVRRPYEVRLPGGLTLPRQTRLVAHNRLEEEFLQLVEAWQTSDPLGELEATGGLLRVLTALLRRTTVTEPDASMRDRVRIEKALELLRNPGAVTCRPAALALAVGLSVSHFNRLFREWTGFAPVEYQRRQRVARARELLGNARLSIKEISAQCGFDDPYHFSRVFRQVDGLSPSQYREVRLAGRPR